MIILRLKDFSFYEDAPLHLEIDNNITLRRVEKYTDSCLGKIAKLLAKINYIRKRLQRLLDYEVLYNGEFIGVIEMCEKSHEEVNIVWLSVVSSMRGHGIATKVLLKIILYCKSAGYKYMTLEVPGESPDARHIYEKLGFVAGKYLGDDSIWGGLTEMKLKL